jgi:Zn-dependent M28 family amino/carboxypeptidase
MLYAASFDMMGKRLYKTYVNLSNIIVRVSNGTLAGKEHAVLINAHLDSTLPSPGAADDALSVGVMLECMRVLLNTPDWSPNHAIIFRAHTLYTLQWQKPHSENEVFNNAEESLQDGSHLYSTQHSTAST